MKRLKLCIQDQNGLNKDIGMIVSIGFVVSVFGSLGVGRLLDMTKKFKLILVANTALLGISYILFTALASRGILWLDHILVYLILMHGLRDVYGTY